MVPPKKSHIEVEVSSELKFWMDENGFQNLETVYSTVPLNRAQSEIDARLYRELLIIAEKVNATEWLNDFD